MGVRVGTRRGISIIPVARIARRSIGKDECLSFPGGIFWQGKNSRMIMEKSIFKI